MLCFALERRRSAAARESLTLSESPPSLPPSPWLPGRSSLHQALRVRAEWVPLQQPPVLPVDCWTRIRVRAGEVEPERR